MQGSKIRVSFPWFELQAPHPIQRAAVGKDEDGNEAGFKTVLTEAAKATIRTLLQQRTGEPEGDEWNPTRMLPSTDPKAYSYVIGFLPLHYYLFLTC